MLRQFNVTSPQSQRSTASLTPDSSESPEVTDGQSVVEISRFRDKLGIFDGDTHRRRMFEEGLRHCSIQGRLPASAHDVAISIIDILGPDSMSGESPYTVLCSKFGCL